VSTAVAPDARFVGDTDRAVVNTGAVVGGGVTSVGVTVSTAELIVVPTVFVHERVNVSVLVAVTVNGPTVVEPEVACAPDQLPLAVHEAEPVVAHVSTAVAPEAIVLGVIARGVVNVGAVVGGGGGVVVKLIFADEAVVPPGPVHVRMYEVFAVIGPTVAVPEVACAPPQPPDAVHDVASVVAHVSTAVAPDERVDGDAESAVVNTGAVRGGGVTVPVGTSEITVD
jgi:hypothetical protein